MRSLTFRATQLLILAIVSVTPLAYLYLIARSYLQPWLPHATGWKALALNLFNAWMLLEVAWLPYHLYTTRRLRVRNHKLVHVAKDKDERMKLLRRCIDVMQKAGGFEQAIEGWFFGTPLENICKGNMIEWIAWAFFDRDPSDLSKDERVEIGDMLALAERSLGRTLSDGYDPQVKCIRLTIDDMQVLHRPFIYYAVLRALHAIAFVLLYALGFRQASVQTMSCSQRYYYRLGVSSVEKQCERALPIVFIHGIGMGLLHYIGLVARLPREVDVFLLDWPHISMRIADEVPTIEDTVACVNMVLVKHNHSQACFVAHSLGTAALSWMIHEKPELVASTVFLDPIVFALVHPAVAYNFVYRSPTTTLELLMHYFVSRELYIAHTLARHFNWSRNILFEEELPPTGKHVVVLSDKDVIVPSHAVRKYLEADKQRKEVAPIDLMWLNDMGHGGLMLRGDVLISIVEKIEQTCRSKTTGLRA